MAVSIRPATVEDAQQIYEMIRELARYEKDEDNVKITAENLQQQLSEPFPPFECIIAEADGKTCGFALFCYTYSTWEGARTLYLEDIYIHPQFRGAGVGAALMSFLAQIAHQRKCKRLEWIVLDWNESAIGFYQRLGAKPVSGWIKYRMNAENIQTLLRLHSAAASII